MQDYIYTYTPWRLHLHFLANVVIPSSGSSPHPAEEASNPRPGNAAGNAAGRVLCRAAVVSIFFVLRCVRKKITKLGDEIGWKLDDEIENWMTVE